MGVSNTLDSIFSGALQFSCKIGEGCPWSCLYTQEGEELMIFLKKQR